MWNSCGSSKQYGAMPGNRCQRSHANLESDLLAIIRKSSGRALLIAAPPFLLASTFAAFQILTRAFGLGRGYLYGFLFYWLFWCAAVPMFVLGWHGVMALFRTTTPRFGRPAWFGVLVLAIPLVLGYGYAFPR